MLHHKSRSSCGEIICVFQPDCLNKICPGLWLADTFLLSLLKPLNGIQRNFDRKQDLNVLYQVCIFKGRSVNKNGRPGRFLKRWHIVLRCMICGPLGLLLVHLSRRLKCTIVIMRCLSSVRPSSVCRWLFSAPEPKAQVHYCDHALSVVRRPSVCLSVCRPSVVNFSHFRLLLWNRLTEFNETWQEART